MRKSATFCRVGDVFLGAWWGRHGGASADVSSEPDDELSTGRVDRVTPPRVRPAPQAVQLRFVGLAPSECAASAGFAVNDEPTPSERPDAMRRASRRRTMRVSIFKIHPSPSIGTDTVSRSCVECKTDVRFGYSELVSRPSVGARRSPDGCRQGGGAGAYRCCLCPCRQRRRRPSGAAAARPGGLGTALSATV